MGLFLLATLVTAAGNSGKVLMTQAQGKQYGRGRWHSPEVHSLSRKELIEQVFAVLAELVRELDVEGDQDVAPFVGLLGQRQPVAGDPLDGGGLDDLVGEVDGDLLPGERGDVHQHSAQRLQNLVFMKV